MQLLLLSPIIFLITYIVSKFNNNYRNKKSKSKYSQAKKQVIKNNNKGRNENKGVKKIPYKTGNGRWKIENFKNYTFYSKKDDQDKSHPGITIDNINGERAILQVTHSKKANKRSVIEIDNIESGKIEKSRINRKLKIRTRNNKKSPITDKQVLETKKVYRTLSEEECRDILNRINSMPSNINTYNEFIKNANKQKG